MSKLIVVRNICRFGSVFGIFLLTGCQWAGVVAPSGGKYRGLYNGQEVVAQVQAKNKSSLSIRVAPAENQPEGSLSPLAQAITFTVKLHFSGNLDIFFSTTYDIKDETMALNENVGETDATTEFMIGL